MHAQVYICVCVCVHVCVHVREHTQTLGHTSALCMSFLKCVCQEIMPTVYKAQMFMSFQKRVCQEIMQQCAKHKCSCPF